MELKGITTALLFWGTCFAAGAQTFNVRNDLNGVFSSASTAWGVEVNDSGQYVIFGNSDYSDSLFFSSVVSSLVLDVNGLIISSDRIVDPVHATYPGWSNSSSKCADGRFVVGGNTFRIDSLDNWISRAALFFFESDGTPEDPILVGPDGESWIGRQAKQTPDGGYVICGGTSAVGDGSQAFVIKTDAQGAEEWVRTFGGAWNDYMVSVDTREGGGYFTGGQFRINSGNLQFWVQCLNDTGAVVWSKVWGGPFHDSNANISTAQNGDVLVAGGWSYGNNALGRRYLARLDPTNGQIIWQRQFGLQAIDGALQVVKEIEPSMDLISAGPAGQGGNYSGTLIRTTSAGDSLWMRSYQYSDSLVTGGRGFFRDVTPTPDGGFVAAGMALPVTGVYSQDVWVVKVDSMGCIEPGCDLITGIETQITNLREALTVYPNPVARGGAVQVNVELPEHFETQGQLRLSVSDAAGRLVHEQKVGPGVSSLDLALATGLYHLHLSDATRWICGAKLLVE